MDTESPSHGGPDQLSVHFSSTPASRPSVNRIPAQYAALRERKSASVGGNRIVELSRSGVERAANSEPSAHPNHPGTIEVKSTPTSENSLPLEAPVSCCSQHHQRGRPLRWGCRGHRVLVPSTFRSCVCFRCPTTSKSLPRNARGYRQAEAGGGSNARNNKSMGTWMGAGSRRKCGCECLEVDGCRGEAGRL